jgi:HRDC domain protein
LQESLHRLIARELAFANPAQNATQADLADILRQKITSVADRWIATISSAATPDLSATPLLERVKAGCRYFSDTFRQLFGSSIADASRCATGDKKLRQRLNTLTTDLRLALSSRLTLLDDISVHGFTVVNYLHFKQQATLGASSAVNVRKSESRKTKESRPVKKAKKDKAPKEPKEKTAEISLRMLRQGMTRADIAEERNLALSTVTGHLRPFVLSGELTMEELYTPPLVTAMADAVEKCGPDNFKMLVSYLKDTGLSPYDIRFYLSSGG